MTTWAVDDRDRSFLALLGSAPVIMLVLDHDFVVRYANDVAARAIGRSADAVRGAAVRSLISSEVDDWLRPSAHRPLVPVALRGEGGVVRTCEAAVTEVDLSVGPATVLALRDVTEREAREHRIAELSRFYETFANVNEAIITAESETELLTAACAACVDRGRYRAGWAVRLDDGGGAQMVAHAGDLGPLATRLEEDPRLESVDPDRTGPTYAALRSGVPQVLDLTAPVDPGAAPPWQAMTLDSGIEALAVLPVRCDGVVVGALGLGAERDHLVADGVQQLLQRLADDVSHGLSRLASQRRLAAVADERRQLSYRLVVAQEEERARIAAAVHDESVASLGAVMLRLGLLRRLLAGGLPAALREVDQVVDELDEVADGLRDLLFELESPPAGATLTDLVADAAAHLLDASPVRWEVRAVGEEHPHGISDVDRIQLVRMIKQVLVNVREHSGARRVDVLLDAQEDGLEVAVTDDGVGFDSGQVDHVPGHRGLADLRDRATASGGWVRVESAPSHGTIVWFWIPWQPTGGAHAPEDTDDGTSEDHPPAPAG